MTNGKKIQSKLRGSVGATLSQLEMELAKQDEQRAYASKQGQLLFLPSLPVSTEPMTDGVAFGDESPSSSLAFSHCNIPM